MDEHTPHSTANMLEITPVTLRRWCSAHADYLSPWANPPERGTARRFTGKDIEVLKHIQSLRAHGMTEAKINEQLQTLTFAEIEEDEHQDDHLSSTELAPSSPDAQHLTPALTVVVNDLEKRFDAKFAALQQASLEAKQSQQNTQAAFYRGMLIGVLIMLGVLVVGLALAYMMGR